MKNVREKSELDKFVIDGKRLKSEEVEKEGRIE